MTSTLTPTRWAWVSAALGLAFCGAGWLNGDIAAYVAQAHQGDLWSRPVHVGYVALAALLAPRAGEHLALALDVVGVAAMAAAAWGAQRRMGSHRVSGALAALASVAVLLPWAPFAEVDPLWIALVVLSAAGVPGAAAAAVAVSPVALLALPWVVAERRTAGGPPHGPGWVPLVEGVAAVGLLSWLSAGGWWTGHRGVLTHDLWLPGRTAAAWLTHLPWLWVAVAVAAGRIRGLRPVLWLAPLVLAPPDVPAFALGGIAIALGLLREPPTGRWRGGIGAVLVVQLGIGIGAASVRAARIRQEARVVSCVAAHLAPGDGLVAPWTWGARVAGAATGDPYGVPWHPPGRWLRDQERAWAPVRRVGTLPPGSGTGPMDSCGVRWSPAP